MDTILDIFTDDAFSLVSLTDTINKMPFVPGRIGKLGLFESEGITTLDVAIEEISGSLSIVPNMPRGAPPSQNIHNKRKIRKLTVPHFPMADTIVADEIQNIREFGTGSQLQGIQSVVDRRMATMAAKLDATVEYGRMGAIQGVILDSDGSTVIYNLYTEFGVSQNTDDFALSSSSTNVLGLITDMANETEDVLGADGYDHIHVLCGRTWWKDFINHAAVKDAYRYFQATGQNLNPLREDLRYKGFEFGGMIWEQYRGKVGGISYVADAEAHAFPVGVPGLFVTRFAPADFVETVNTTGLPRYAKQYPADFSGRAITVETQTNAISFCTRPDVLIKLTES